MLEETVSKQTIMGRLTSSDDSKMELAETLLGDQKVKALAIDKLSADTSKRGELIHHLLADPTAKTAIMEALVADETARTVLQEALKKPLPKKPAAAPAESTTG
jgi:kynurenine formamidase